MRDILVSFETAKLAKLKGFNEILYTSYGINGELGLNPGIYTYSNSDTGTIVAPTQTQLQKWLRENHNMHCDAMHRIENINTVVFSYYINNNPSFTQYATFEEALEEGLLKCVKMI